MHVTAQPGHKRRTARKSTTSTDYEACIACLVGINGYESRYQEAGCPNQTEDCRMESTSIEMIRRPSTEDTDHVCNSVRWNCHQLRLYTFISQLFGNSRYEQ
ncbi:unnamed protein product [Periconia digitata]|uniref:Uncharacterized protein n=1 Tax=Periconia digitata TaxID=1303443 RepID=A0A9W4XQT0_9PLEO|nr:unnamed protein product [Periconia digitata]